MSQREDHLAYGHYYSQDGSRSGTGESARGLVGDTFKKLKSTYKSHQGSPAQGQQAGSNQQQSPGQQPNQSQPPNSPYQNPQSQGKPPKQDKVSGLLGKLQGTVADFGGDFAQRIGTALDPQAYAEYGQQNPDTDYRFGSFAPARQGNDVKWYVDGCSYFYAVSKSLENARESIWILDWWLSPELYLRRPPAKNEQYRLDRMLQAAAQRGVRVNIIVYKEVTQALTLSSSHTKHHLEDLHPNIAVFRHPDHLPDAQELTASITSSLQNFSLDAASLAKMPGEAIKGIYGMNDDVILYWAHHEKLCLIDGRVAFMGGLDLCFGRWDTNQHSLSDVHPTDLNEIVFPGQDYNNARVLDFQDVSHWEQNQLDRKSASRMGWSDVALSLHGQVVEDLRRHFVERWNYIYDAKYEVRKEQRYSRLALFGRPSSAISQSSQSQKPDHVQQPGAGQQQPQSSQPQQPSQQPQQQAPQWQQAQAQQPQSPQPQQPSQQPQQQAQPQWQQSQSPQPQQPSQQPQQQAPQWQQAQAQQPQSPQPQQPSQQPQQQAQPQWQQSQSPQPQQPPQQPQQQAPQWQQAQAQQPQSPQPQQPSQQPQLAELQASSGWQQQAQPQQPQQQPQQPQVPQEKPQWQQQQPTEYKPYRPDGASNTPPPQNAGRPSPSHQSPPPSYQAYEPQSTPQQYTYSGQSFPPPPPGAPPNKPNEPQTQQSQQGQQQGQQGQAPYFPPPPTQEGSQYQTRCVEDHEGTRGGGDLDRGFALPRRFKKDDLMQYSNNFRGQLAGQIHQYQDRLTTLGRPQAQARGNMSCQIVRSCSKWSHGSDTEHSIADAYSAIIRNSEHCVYIENQFFITATSDSQKPVKNKIGAAIVERILRAARAGQKYKIIVVIPCVPCFAGDLSDESTLGTRAIMEFQYNSINRGGNSIMELIAKEGYNPMEYIRFYNLRNYDRINLSGPLADAEQRSGVNYEEARKEQDVKTGGQSGYGPGAPRSAFDPSAPFQQYQNAAQQVSGKPSSGQWDSVSSCYMLNGEDLRKVPWDGPAEAEIDAFVTEELYVHSKVMIADDRIVICGSANINDRSQLGDHDSEIAVIIEDYTPISSTMNGKPWTASRFAASLRRQLFRKHLGLLPPQDPQRPDANYEPVGVANDADLDSPESQLVADPLADPLHSVWNTRARTNTEAFRKVFHSVPDDSVRDWATYKEFYGYYFHKADKQAYGEAKDAAPARYRYGHVVRDNFPPGPEGVKQVKELLSQVKGTLVEMPLMFLIQEDVAKEGLTLNEVTEPIYT